MAYDYIKNDLAGYPYNGTYPPDYKKNGGLYHGYPGDKEESFFYDFAVQRYDLRVGYNSKMYWFTSDSDHAAQCDEDFHHEIQLFEDGNAVLEQFLIDGKRLIDLIPLIEDYEVY